MQSGRINVRRKVVLAATSLVGLLLAIGGLTPAATAAESLPARLVLDLPAWLGIPFIVLLCLATLFIAFLLVPAMRPRPEKREVRRRSAMAQVLLLLAGTLLWAGLKDHLDINLDDVARKFMELAGPPGSVTVPDAEQPPAVHSALVTGIVEVLLLALAFMAFAVLAWLYLIILPERSRGVVPSPLDGPALHAAVEDSLDDLRHLPDARLAIIRCYDRFERALAAADIRRPPWQTTLEFMRTTLKHPRLPDAGVCELTRLFEIARFSRHELGPDHREKAWQALVAVKSALEKEDRHVPAP